MQNKAKAYNRFRYLLAVIDIFYELTLLFIFLKIKAFSYLAEILKAESSGVLPFVLYLLIVFVVYALLKFPLHFYSTFFLEHKFSLSIQRFKEWLLDQFKTGIVFFLLSILLLSVFFWIVEVFPKNWWLIATFLWFIFNVVLARIFPLVILPLFFKCRKIEDDNLRQRVMQLAEKMKIRLLDCFEIDFSRKTLKANAGLVGFGRSLRVILADTLKENYSYDEIEVILAHEFAHFRLRHLWKMILLNSFFTLFIFYFLFISNALVLRFFGITSLSKPDALGVILLYFVILGLLFTPWQAYLGRKMERNADKLALRTTGLTDAFVSLMRKLAEQNLSDPKPHPLIKFFFFDHPPIEERISYAQINL